MPLAVIMGRLLVKAISLKIKRLNQFGIILILISH